VARRQCSYVIAVYHKEAFPIGQQHASLFVQATCVKHQQLQSSARARLQGELTLHRINELAHRTLKCREYLAGIIITHQIRLDRDPLRGRVPKDAIFVSDAG
jgi:hypothetical protein